MNKLNEIVDKEAGLKRGMRSRHMFMISIGGVIGTGLFVGSGYTINQAGPGGAVLAYILGGILVGIVMMSLGELATIMPVAGSFKTYAQVFISPSIGFLSAWLYWINGAITITVEWLAAVMILQQYFPHIPSVVFYAVFFVIYLVLNIMAVGVYGESEFWFASIKVIGIIVASAVGIAVIFGWTSHPAIGATNYLHHGGLFPNGVGASFLALVSVCFSYSGTELIGIAAGESQDPSKSVPRAVRTTTLRTLLFYVLAMIVLVGIIPWQTAGVNDSPFATIFQFAGIPSAHVIMDIIVVTSALSAGSSWTYASSRLLWSMSLDGMAPKFLSTLSKRQVPVRSVLFTMIIGVAGLLLYKVSPDKLYTWILSGIGLVVVIDWGIICWAQIGFRRKYVRSGGKVSDLPYRTPLYPILPLVGIIANAAIAVSLWFVPGQRITIYTGVPIMAIIMLYYFLFARKKILAKQNENKEQIENSLSVELS
ncbi:amino acid permease [Alicyclobacillus fastidiosus]|uniref:Amino acid permease n=1 Tax=Alicyclobacillus fastidiosus TaxID=392011 RepID=A0ABY6ZGF9_9BACL|nr:amino acid permease [Alicyclobacillus fastidiosus]WAH41204.1 amino acid permease [Alicyclobacillus fastidiosus]GMA62782.1 amino acid permease [Alicyclobacillus fastidiosus]